MLNLDNVIGPMLLHYFAAKLHGNQAHLVS